MRLTLSLGRIFTYVPRIPGKFSTYALNSFSAGDDPDAESGVARGIVNAVFRLLIALLIVELLIFIWFKFFMN